MPVAEHDRSVRTDRGTLFTRTWTPSVVGAAARESFLLFHDSLGSVDLWRDFPARLADATHRRVIAYDRLGFGRSDAYPGKLSPTFTRDEAEQSVPFVIDALGVDQLIPFGHSVGGSMAVATAARFPDRCATVITESAQSFVEERTLAGIRAAKANFGRSGQVERLARYHGDRAQWVLDAWIETWLDPAFAQWNFDDALRRLRCPVLALHGEHDEFGSLEHPRRIGRLAGGSTFAPRVVIMEGVGHVPHREQPARVLDEIVRFLRDADVGELAPT